MTPTAPTPALHTDIHPGWVDRFCPAFARPYARLMRLDRPIGTWLLLFPCWWGLALSARVQGAAWPDWTLMALFAVGAVVMRGAGCTLNDIMDCELDAKVARTRTRPIPSGQVKAWQAFIFFWVLCLIGLGILLQLNVTTWFWGAGALPLVMIYPIMKRLTWWPQFFLGLAFNWGALMGWAAVTETVEGGAWLLYTGGIMWTLAYDTIYAHQDKDDDFKAGMRSTALLLGKKSPMWVLMFYALAIGLFTLAGANAGLGPLFQVSMAIAILVAVGIARDWDIDNPAQCLRKFKANRWIGWIVLGGIMLG